MSASLQAIMQELQATEGLQFATLFANDGAITSAQLSADENTTQRAMAIGMGAIEAIGKAARQAGAVQRAIIEMDGARVLFSYLADKAVLCVVTDGSYNTGLLVSTTRKWEEELLAVLSPAAPADTREAGEAP